MQNWHFSSLSPTSSLGENRNFEYKDDKATTRILNFYTKTIENKHFIHYLKRFPQTLSVFFIMPTSKDKYQCFLILVQSFSACTFQESIRWLFPIQTFISFVIHVPFKWPRQEAKTKRYSQQQEAKSVRRRPPSAKEFSFGALGQGRCADWLDCIAYCIFWHLIGSEQLSYFSWIGQFAYL